MDSVSPFGFGKPANRAVSDLHSRWDGHEVRFERRPYVGFEFVLYMSSLEPDPAQQRGGPLGAPGERSMPKSQQRRPSARQGSLCDWRLLAPPNRSAS